jgi:hypothetical protein
MVNLAFQQFSKEISAFVVSTKNGKPACKECNDRGPFSGLDKLKRHILTQHIFPKELDHESEDEEDDSESSQVQDSDDEPQTQKKYTITCREQCYERREDGRSRLKPDAVRTVCQERKDEIQKLRKGLKACNECPKRDEFGSEKKLIDHIIACHIFPAEFKKPINEENDDDSQMSVESEQKAPNPDEKFLFGQG